MGFLITGIWQGHYDLKVSAAEYATEENAFTILVGENATGKSRLLRRIVSAFIYPSNSNGENGQSRVVPGYHNDCFLAFESKNLPAAVIAVSTGRHDRFPPADTNLANVKYSYVTSPETVRESLAESLREIFRKSFFRPSEMSLLGDVLVRLGFAPILSFRVSTTRKTKNILERLSNIDQTLFGKDFLDLRESFGVENEFIFDNENEFNYFRKQHKLNVEINFKAGIISVNSKVRTEIIFEMIDRGFLAIDGLTLIYARTKSRMQYAELSSGQRCILTILLGIAGTIVDDSLICIDEPEISLHPKWQEEIIELLQICFSDYKGCHFFIATHSPQVVSGLVSGLGFVLDMQTRRLLSPNDYSNRSADFQLAEVFHAPGRANEYILRQCLILLSKLKEKQYFTDEDTKRFHWLAVAKHRLDHEDPVYHLIEQLENLIR